MTGIGSKGGSTCTLPGARAPINLGIILFLYLAISLNHDYIKRSAFNEKIS